MTSSTSVRINGMLINKIKKKKMKKLPEDCGQPKQVGMRKRKHI